MHAASLNLPDAARSFHLEAASGSRRGWRSCLRPRSSAPARPPPGRETALCESWGANRSAHPAIFRKPGLWKVSTADRLPSLPRLRKQEALPNPGFERLRVRLRRPASRPRLSLRPHKGPERGKRPTPGRGGRGGGSPSCFLVWGPEGQLGHRKCPLDAGPLNRR